jgi:hypothetical protein
VDGAGDGHLQEGASGTEVKCRNITENIDLSVRISNSSHAFLLSHCEMTLLGYCGCVGGENMNRSIDYLGSCIAPSTDLGLTPLSLAFPLEKYSHYLHMGSSIVIKKALYPMINHPCLAAFKLEKGGKFEC